MITAINNINNKNTSAPKTQPNFGGALDGAITNTLRTLDTNPMVNAVGIDLFSMVAPRTYIDTKKRNKYAGAETFFREFTGTLIVCLSASYFAKGISRLANKLVKPNVKINPKSWFSNDSLAFLQEVSQKSKGTNQYVTKILDSLSGLDRKEVKQFKNIDWANTEWVDESKWRSWIWDDAKLSNAYHNLKNKNSIINAISRLINDKKLSENDAKKLQSIIELRLTNALKADKVNANLGDKSVSTSMHNILRDTIDFGRDILTNKEVDPKEAVEKILKINKIKSLGALSAASALGLSNQYINRKITEKRTGKQGFVGENDYQNTQGKTNGKDKSKLFTLEKLLASAGMAAMAIWVMKVKSPKDFLKKLEFTGAVTGGNAIKTVYGATLIGRFLASDNKKELRETVFRDYFGFLNWLVFGGFAAKGSANLLDKNREYLFNTSKDGKGVRHWLNDLSLKSHNEIASKGSEFAKRNMWKLNVAHAAGLAYSMGALGILLPMLNILMSNKKPKNQPQKQVADKFQPMTFEGFLKTSDKTANIA